MALSRTLWNRRLSLSTFTRYSARCRNSTNSPCGIDSYTFDPLIDSSDVEPSFWQSLALLIQQRYDEYDGFVVLHGTDTMAYSASALSFMLENLAKPVVFTGSQLPIGVPRTDGKENLISAVRIRGPPRTRMATHGCRRSAYSSIPSC